MFWREKEGISHSKKERRTILSFYDGNALCRKCAHANKIDRLEKGKVILQKQTKEKKKIEKKTPTGIFETLKEIIIIIIINVTCFYR